MSRKRKVIYPPPITSRRPPPPGSDSSPERPNLATINLQAIEGRAGFAVGDRVRIEAAGMHTGKVGVIERMSMGVIPSALVRVTDGGTRQVRTIDLVPAKAETATVEAPKAEADQPEA